MLLAGWNLRDEDAWRRATGALEVGPGPLVEWRDEAVDVRFAAMDSLGGNAPLLLEDSACVVAFVGMPAELRGRAAAAHIASRYRRGGVGALAALDGEWSFILWDRAERTLVAASDAVGALPLYYAFGGGALAVGTRALSVAAHPRLEGRLDDRYFAHALLGTWDQPPESTPFAGVRRLVAGRALVVRDGRLDERTFATLDDGWRRGDRRSEEAYVDELWSTLDGAVRERVEGRGRVALGFSGGLDSSVVGEALVQAGGDFVAISARSSIDAGADEARAIGEFRKMHPAIAHRVSDPVDGGDELPLADEPLAVASSFVPSRVGVCRVARDEGCSVLVVGEGGDELFDLGTQWRAAVDRGELLRAVAGLAAMPRSAARERVVALLVESAVPPAVRRWLAARPAVGARAPEILKADFLESDAAREAVAEGTARRPAGRFPARLRTVLGDVAFRATLGHSRLTARAFGLEYATPLVAPEVVRLFLRLPAALLVTTSERKPFLRRAARGRVAPTAVTAAKDDRGYEAVRARYAADPALGHELLALVAADPLLCGAVDARKVGALFALATGPAEETVASLLEAGRWRRRVRDAVRRPRGG